jgi:hypothetical protein
MAPVQFIQVEEGGRSDRASSGIVSLISSPPDRGMRAKVIAAWRKEVRDVFSCRHMMRSFESIEGARRRDFCFLILGCRGVDLPVHGRGGGEGR